MNEYSRVQSSQLMNSFTQKVKTLVIYDIQSPSYGLTFSPYHYFKMKVRIVKRDEQYLNC